MGSRAKAPFPYELCGGTGHLRTEPGLLQERGQNRLSVDWRPDSWRGPVVAALLAVAWVLEEVGGCARVGGAKEAGGPSPDCWSPGAGEAAAESEARACVIFPSRRQKGKRPADMRSSLLWQPP